MWRRSLVSQTACTRTTGNSKVSLSRALGVSHDGSPRHIHSTCSRQIDVHALIAQRLKQYNVPEPEKRYSSVEQARPRPSSSSYRNVYPAVDSVADKGRPRADSQRVEATVGTTSAVEIRSHPSGSDPVESTAETSASAPADISVVDSGNQSSGSVRVDSMTETPAPARKTNRFSAMAESPATATKTPTSFWGPDEENSMSPDRSGLRPSFDANSLLSAAAPSNAGQDRPRGGFEDAFASVRRDDSRVKGNGSFENAFASVRRDDGVSRTPSRTNGQSSTDPFKAAFASVRRGDDASRTPSRTQGQSSADPFKAAFASVRRDDISPAQNSTQFKDASSSYGQPSSLRPSVNAFTESRRDSVVQPAKQAFVQEKASSVVDTRQDPTQGGSEQSFEENRITVENTEQNSSPEISEQTIEEKESLAEVTGQDLSQEISEQTIEEKESLAEVTGQDLSQEISEQTIEEKESLAEVTGQDPSQETSEPSIEEESLAEATGQDPSHEMSEQSIEEESLAEATGQDLSQEMSEQSIEEQASLVENTSEDSSQETSEHSIEEESLAEVTGQDSSQETSERSIEEQASLVENTSEDSSQVVLERSVEEKASLVEDTNQDSSHVVLERGIEEEGLAANTEQDSSQETPEKSLEEQASPVEITGEDSSQVVLERSVEEKAIHVEDTRQDSSEVVLERSVEEKESLAENTEQDSSQETTPEKNLDKGSESLEAARPRTLNWEKNQTPKFMTHERPSPTWTIIDTEQSVPQMVELLLAGRLEDRPSLYFHFRGNRPMGMLIYALHRNEIFAIDTSKLGYAAFNPIRPAALDSEATTFKDLLESREITKVFYDVRQVKLLLWEEYRVDLHGVEDLQLMDAASRPKPHFQELDRCITDYLITSTTLNHNPHYWYRALNQVPIALAEHGIKKGGFQKLEVPRVRRVWQHRLQGMTLLYDHYSATPGNWMDRARKETERRLHLPTIQNTPKITLRKNLRLTRTPVSWYDVWRSKSPLARERNPSELGAERRPPSKADMLDASRKEAVNQSLINLYRTTAAIRDTKLRRFNIQALEQVIENTGHSKLDIRSRAGGSVSFEEPPEEEPDEFPDEEEL